MTKSTIFIYVLKVRSSFPVKCEKPMLPTENGDKLFIGRPAA